MAERTNSLEGWWIIDSVDGRRWCGLVLKREDGFVHFAKCLEFWPLSITAVVVPQMPASSILGKGPQGPQLAIQNVQSDASLFSPPCGIVGMPPWRVKEAGGCACLDLPAEFRDSLLKSIQSIEKAIDQALVDAKRAQIRGV